MNTKTIFKTMALCALLAAAAVACKKDKVEDGNTTVAVTSVSLSCADTTLTAGGTLTLTATVAPDNAANKAVAWSSSNTAVATVDDGLVTAVAAGTATITVTTEDGGKTATCDVTVAVSVEGVTLSQPTAEITVTDTLRLTAAVAPENAANKAVAWTSSNTAVATVSGGLVTAVAAGTATITATTQDGGKTDTCAVTVNPIPDMALGGITWAACNVDDYQAFASRPDRYTKFYQWNRETAWAATGSVSGLETSITDSEWTVNPCPAGWRLPTQAEFRALIDVSGGFGGTNAKVKGNAVAGRFFGPSYETCTLPNNMAGCVFLPAVGTRDYVSDDGVGMLIWQGSYGTYWSSTQNNSSSGYFLFLSNSGYSNSGGNHNKANGLSVRCVQ